MNDELYVACAKSIHVLMPKGQKLNSGRAVLYILHGLGYWWVQVGSIWPLIYLVEFVYWIVSTNRSFFARFLFTKERESREE